MTCVILGLEKEEEEEDGEKMEEKKTSDVYKFILLVPFTSAQSIKTS